jgi:hypothetical protein
MGLGKAKPVISLTELLRPLDPAQSFLHAGVRKRIFF